VLDDRPSRVAVAGDDVESTGREDSEAISASSSVVSGVVSLGLRTTVLPAARAGAIFQIAIIMG
jgi:hypothetical protein